MQPNRSTLATTALHQIFVPTDVAEIQRYVAALDLAGAIEPCLQLAKWLSCRADAWGDLIEMQCALESKPSDRLQRAVKRDTEILRAKVLEVGWTLRLVRGFARTIEWDGIASPSASLDRFAASLVAAKLRTVRMFRLGDADLEWLALQPALRSVAVVELRSHAFTTVGELRARALLPHAVFIASQYEGNSMANRARSAI